MNCKTFIRKYRWGWNHLLEYQFYFRFLNVTSYGIEKEEKIVLYETKNDKNLIPIVLKEIFWKINKLLYE